MNLLVTGAWSNAEENLVKLEQMGHSVVFMQCEAEQIPCDNEWIEGVICNGLFLSHPIEKFTNLKYIQLTSAGFDRVPMDFVRAHGITINNARGVYSIPMSEFVFAGVLQIYKQFQFFRDNQDKCIWEKNRNLLELYGNTVCIVGCGNVGTECAKRFAAFGCDVVGIDLFPRFDENYSRILGLDKLNEVLPETDLLILTLPLTKETKHLMNMERFKKLKRGAVLVNIARGAVIDTEALIQHLDKLGGAVLDVFEDEPLNECSILWNAVNVIITPHNSFVGNNNQKRMLDVIIRNLEGISL